MEIKTEDYRILYDATTATVTCEGSLRLSGMEEYAPIVQLLNDVAESEPSKIVLNLRDLEFLNSSGINMLSKFAIKVRQKGDIEMVVQGSQDIPWQGKSLRNLLRLMPSLKLELD
ncbi:MAG: slr1659 superfamily regulator [Actinomycetota bacterium]